MLQPRMKPASLLLMSLALAALPIAASAAPTKASPPALFQQLAKSVSTAGFHLNDVYPDGWYAASICKRHPTVAACTAMIESWAASVVADKKEGTDAVVQELWVFAYASSADAAKAMTSLDKDFDFGPFNKHPYQLFSCGRLVFATEGRFRWHTAGKQLNQHVGVYLAKHCPKKK